MTPRILLRAAAAAALITLPLTSALASDLVVEVTGAPSQSGQIGCALYASSSGFPMDTATAIQVWQGVTNNGATCRFDGLAAGTYAVAVSHDTNANKKTDTNLIGIPTEAWGVSNNVRPRMRAPRFEEAGFAVPAEGTFKISVRLE